jgi:hypoxanthine phosphoribosyltransferase
MIQLKVKVAQSLMAFVVTVSVVVVRGGYVVVKCLCCRLIRGLIEVKAIL